MLILSIKDTDKMSMIGDYIYKDDKCVGKGTFGTVYTAYKNNHPEVSYHRNLYHFMGKLSRPQIDKILSFFFFFFSENRV